MSRPSSSRRARISSLIARRIRLRSYAGSLRVIAKAASAARTASSYCSGVALYVAPVISAGFAGFAI
jgi:hypothetical protein